MKNGHRSASTKGRGAGSQEGTRCGRHLEGRSRSRALFSHPPSARRGPGQSHQDGDWTRGWALPGRRASELRVCTEQCRVPWGHGRKDREEVTASLARAARGRRAAGGGGLAGGRGWAESQTPEGRAGSGRRKGQGTGCGRGSEWPRRGEDADRRVKTHRGPGARRALGASPRRTRRPRSRGSGLQERRGHSGRTEGGAWGTRTAPSSKAAEFSRRRDRGRGERGDARAELRGATGRSPLARPGAGHVAVSSEGQPGGWGGERFPEAPETAALFSAVLMARVLLSPLQSAR